MCNLRVYTPVDRILMLVITIIEHRAHSATLLGHCNVYANIDASYAQKWTSCSLCKFSANIKCPVFKVKQMLIKMEAKFFVKLFFRVSALTWDGICEELEIFCVIYVEGGRES